MTDGRHIGREDERKRNIGTEKKGGREEQRKGAEGTRNDARRPCPRRRRAAVLPRGAGRPPVPSPSPRGSAAARGRAAADRDKPGRLPTHATTSTATVRADTRIAANGVRNLTLQPNLTWNLTLQPWNLTLQPWSLTFRPWNLTIAIAEPYLATMNLETLDLRD